MIFDLHCDTVFKLREERHSGTRSTLASSALQIDEKKLKTGGYFAQCFAMFVPAKEEDPYRVFTEMADLYDAEIELSEALEPVWKFEDFEKNRRNGKISAVLTMEDAAPIGEELENLQTFYDRGVRMIGLTWNYKNAVGYPNIRNFTNTGIKPDLFTPETKKGLTEFGKDLVRKMNGLGIVADVSHLSDKGFYDVIEISEKPIMASHSNARGVCRNVRNLTDDMLKKLADNGGVTGINYAAGFLNEDERLGKRTVACAIEHIRYITKKIGTDHVALGSDFDGIDPEIELADASKTPLLLQALDRAGFTSEEIEKIAYKNALRVFKENMK